MKKIIAFLIFAFVSFSIFSQNNDADIKKLKEKIDKNNQEVSNPKKSQDPNFWIKRAELFIEAFKVNSKYLAIGLEANSIPLLGITESSPNPFYGKATSIERQKDYEVWVYPKIKIYINNETRTIEFWEDLYVIDPQALDKAYEAYTKALELDAAKKVVSKTKVKQQVAELRELLMNRAIEKYNKEQHKDALADLEKSIKLYNDFPRLPNDTTVKIGPYYYYAGVFAYNAKELTAAITYFNKSIDEKYEIGSCYQYISQSYLEQKDTAKAEQILIDGANKYPNQEKIIYSLIDFYTPRGEFDKAFIYIEKAIEMTPNMPQLYFVQGNAYERVYYTIEKEYFRTLKSADSLDKEAFKNRNNPTKAKEMEQQRDILLQTKVVEQEKKIDDYVAKVVKSYNKALELSPKNIDVTYQFAYFYYTRAINYKTTASNISKLKDIQANMEKVYDQLILEAKKYAEEARSIDPNDIYTLRLLKNIYYRLQLLDEYNEVNEKIKQLQNK